MGIERLSPREREVAAIAVTGCSTQDIADELYLSARTVESHLSSIYRKVGVTSRSALVAKLAGPVSAGSLGAPAAVPSLLGFAAPPSFVGRHEELLVFDKALGASRAGSWRFVTVGGEMGAGKTTLVAKALESALAPGTTLLAGRCVEDLATPFGPLADALRPFLTDRPGLLEPVVGPQGGALATILPSLASRLPTLSHAVDPGVLPRLVAGAVLQVLRYASSFGTTILVIEDMHWVDRATVALLRFLLASPEELPVLVVMTFRDTEIEPGHPLTGLLADLRKLDEHQGLALRGLSLDDTLLLGRSLGGGLLDEEQVVRLHTQCAGNAFYLAQLLANDNGGATGQEVGGDLLTASILERVDRLGGPPVGMLEVAAVIGLEFDLAIAEEAVVLAGLPEHPRPIDLVERAERAGLLAPIPGLDEHRFVHDVVRTALLGRLSTSRLARLHQAVGRAFVALRGDGPADAALVAAHLAKSPDAGDRIQSGRRALQAVTSDVARLAPDDAAELATTSLRTLPMGADADAVRLDLLIALSEIHYLRLDHDSHRRAVLEAVEVARRTGDPVDLARALVPYRLLPRTGTVDEEILALVDEAVAGLRDDGTAVLRARLGGYAAYHRSVGGAGFSVAPLAEGAVTDARASGSPAALAMALYTLAGVLLGSPDTDRQLAVGSELATLRDQVPAEIDPTDGIRLSATVSLQIGDRPAFERDRAALQAGAQRTLSAFMGSMTTMFRATMALCEGDLGVAAAANDALLGEALGDPNVLLGWFAQLCGVRLAQGRGHEVVTLAEQTLADHGDLAVVRALVGWVIHAVGESEAAWSVVEPVVARGPHLLPDDWVLAASLAMLSAVVTEHGTDEDCVPLADRLRPYSGQLVVVGSGTLVLGAADHFLGLLHARLGDHGGAVALLSSAVEREEGLGATLLAAHSRLAIAGLELRGEADRACAHPLLAELGRQAAVHGWLGLARDIERTQARA